MFAISLEGVSKRYRILPSQRDRLKSILTFGKSKAGRDFWALEDINLEVEQGTALGVLGRNGAGKSTLLTLISGVTQPTSGTVRVNGRLVALLQLGAGFNDDFTGRENIMLNGLILGIERKEMLERVDEITAFADIGEFIDQPLKTYSSGMRARLGFAVAVNVKPDILLVDEVLATGDALFKAKSLKKMEELRDTGVTILFVSHSTQQVQDFCNEAALLHKGRLMSRGDTSEVVAHYEALLSDAAAQRENQRGLDRPFSYENVSVDGEEEPETLDSTPGSPSLRRGTGDARIQKVELIDDHSAPVNEMAPESNITVRVHVRYAKAVDESFVGIALNNDAGLRIFATTTGLERTSIGARQAGENVVVDFTFRVPLKHGRYSVAAGVFRPKMMELDRISVAASFEISRPSDRNAFVGLVHLPTRVEVFEPGRVLEHKPPG